jgi:hypothetical protein
MSLDEFQALFDNGSFHRLLFWQPSITEGLSQYQESEFSLQCLACWEKLFRTINLCANMALLPGAPDIPRLCDLNDSSGQALNPSMHQSAKTGVFREAYRHHRFDHFFSKYCLPQLWDKP